MSKSVINFKVDKEVKEEAQKLAKELGIPLSTIINSQLHQLLRTRRLELDATSTMTPYLESVLEEVERDRRTKKNISPVFDTAEEMFEHLRKTA